MATPGWLLDPRQMWLGLASTSSWHLPLRNAAGFGGNPVSCPDPEKYRGSGSTVSLSLWHAPPRVGTPPPLPSPRLFLTLSSTSAAGDNSMTSPSRVRRPNCVLLIAVSETPDGHDAHLLRDIFPPEPDLCKVECRPNRQQQPRVLTLFSREAFTKGDTRTEGVPLYLFRRRARGGGGDLCNAVNRDTLPVLHNSCRASLFSRCARKLSEVSYYYDTV